MSTTYHINIILVRNDITLQTGKITYQTRGSTFLYFIFNKLTYTTVIKNIRNIVSTVSKVYYFKELNCDSAKSEFKYQRIIDNLNHITVYVLQQLTTDIRGIIVEK